MQHKLPVTVETAHVKRVGRGVSGVRSRGNPPHKGLNARRQHERREVAQTTKQRKGRGATLGNGVHDGLLRSTPFLTHERRNGVSVSQTLTLDIDGSFLLMP